MRVKNILALVVSIAICQLAGVVGGLVTASSVDTWYATLRNQHSTRQIGCFRQSGSLSTA